MLLLTHCHGILIWLLQLLVLITSRVQPALLQQIRVAQ